MTAHERMGQIQRLAKALVVHRGDEFANEYGRDAGNQSQVPKRSHQLQPGSGDVPFAKANGLPRAAPKLPRTFRGGQG